MIIIYLDDRAHFGASTWELCDAIFQRCTPADLASMSRSLRRLREQGLVEYFTVPTVAENAAKGTEGRRLRLWDHIVYRRKGLPQPRKFFKLTRKARRMFGLPTHDGRYAIRVRREDGAVAQVSDRIFRHHTGPLPPDFRGATWRLSQDQGENR